MTNRLKSLPGRLREVSVEREIEGVPCLLVRSDSKPRPFLFWMHGRTAYKELDAGRYLRCLRSGVNVCAVDLPGHGQRFEESAQEASHILPVVEQMVGEIDDVLGGLAAEGGFDVRKAAIGGMSAGGMAAIKRLQQAHPFKAAIFEATTGSWGQLRSKPMCKALDQKTFDGVNPINHLKKWSDIPIIAFHSKLDEWIPYGSQLEFIEALRIRSNSFELIEFISFDKTGAPFEHVGFGQQSATVKEQQVEFLMQHLQINQGISA